jgi:hypothetical protein
MPTHRRKRSKFGNIRTEIDGINFHSKKEAARYLVLKEALAAGEITDLRLQVSHQIIVNGKKICRYISDFEYLENGLPIVEDVKGRLTDVYKLKKKLMAACHNIEIRET